VERNWKASLAGDQAPKRYKVTLVMRPASPSMCRMDWPVCHLSGILSTGLPVNSKDSDDFVRLPGHGEDSDDVCFDCWLSPRTLEYHMKKP
jgi:hypothetical protein